MTSCSPQFDANASANPERMWSAKIWRSWSVSLPFGVTLAGERFASMASSANAVHRSTARLDKTVLIMFRAFCRAGREEKKC